MKLKLIACAVGILQSDYYWFGTPYGNSVNLARSFRLSTGEQYYQSVAGSLMRAWAVRDGDVAAVPLPGAAWLFGSMLTGFIYAGRARTGKFQHI
jgi:hypothetical protein